MQEVVDEAFARPVIVNQLLIEIGLLEPHAAVGVDAAADVGLHSFRNRGPDAVVIWFRPAVQSRQHIDTDRAEIREAKASLMQQ